MNVKFSTLLMSLVVSGLTVVLYVIVLSELYFQGYWATDLLTLLLAEAALLGGYAGTIGFAKLSTQAIARWSIIRQAGIVLAFLTILHTICCILVPFSVETVYWIVFGISIVVFSVRMFFVHTGAAIQEQIESKQHSLYVQQQAIAQILHPSTIQLVDAIQNADAEEELKFAASDAVKSISTMVDGFALKKIERNSSLKTEISLWNEHLIKMKDALNSGDSNEKLKKIAHEARKEADVINNLYLQ